MPREMEAVVIGCLIFGVFLLFIYIVYVLGVRQNRNWVGFLSKGLGDVGMEEKNCQRCGTTLEIGLITHPTIGIPVWIQGPFEFSPKGHIVDFKKKREEGFVLNPTFRCPVCGLVELYAKTPMKHDQQHPPAA